MENGSQSGDDITNVETIKCRTVPRAELSLALFNSPKRTVDTDGTPACASTYAASSLCSRLPNYFSNVV